MTRERQSRITPEIALKMLQEGNDRFLAGKLAKRDLHEQVKMTGHGQFPFASVVSCIDSRAAPEVIFDQGVGDIFTARVAGNVVNRDIIGSLEYGSKVAGARVIVIMGHTHCGAVKGICDNVKMGNLTDLLEKLRPAMDSVPEDGTPRNSKNASFVDRVAEANVHRQVRQLLSDSPVLRGLVSEGKLMVVGAMLDVETGRVTFFENHDPAEQMAVHDSLHL
ncbi:MAG: carbonic anhydrase [Betaproteobacteria bacterium]|nr:carbonic anhydrase [Betaproteobacteria bacterium]